MRRTDVKISRLGSGDRRERLRRGHCVQRLLEVGHNVIAMQRSPRPLTGPLSRDSDTFRYIEGDLAQGTSCTYPIRSIVHLAAQVVFPGIKAGQFAHGNILPTLGMFKLAQSLAVETVIMHSSVSVYGHPQSDTWSESTSSTAPTPYGASKYVCELVAADYAGKMRIIIPRTPGILGTGANPNWVTNLVDRASSNQTLEIYNAAARFNSTLHVADYCDFVLAELASEETSPSIEVVNLAATDPIPVIKVASTIVNEVSSRSKIVDKGPSGAPAVIEIGKARTRFGFKPMSVENTLKRYIKDILGRS